MRKKWLEQLFGQEERGERKLVEPRCFLLEFTKTQSPQIWEITVEKTRSKSPCYFKKKKYPDRNVLDVLGLLAVFIFVCLFLDVSSFLLLLIFSFFFLWLLICFLLFFLINFGWFLFLFFRKHFQINFFILYFHFNEVPIYTQFLKYIMCYFLFYF